MINPVKLHNNISFEMYDNEYNVFPMHEMKNPTIKVITSPNKHQPKED